MIVGLDVGGTNARGLLVDPADHRILDRSRASSSGTGPELVHALAGMVRAMGAGVEARSGPVGLAVAGLAHRSGTVHFSPNLPELTGFPIGPALEEELGAGVAVMNDATAGAYGEARLGAGRGSENFAFVALGTGIGTGFVLDGNLVQGANGFAGEAGHMVVEAHGPQHVTGQRGPWEYFGSGNALGRLGREAAASGSFEGGVAAAGSVEAITGQHVSDALAEGDPEAETIFEGFCHNVALGLANLVVVLDVERIVLGGGLVRIGEPLRSGTQGWLEKLLLGSEYRPAVDVVLAKLGPDAGALGAGLLAAEAP